jgi:glutathione peroxidase
MSVYDYEVRLSSGELLPLSDFRDKVLLLVNTASKCGFTKQYEGLQELHNKYSDRGLVVIAFP